MKFALRNPFKGRAHRVADPGVVAEPAESRAALRSRIDLLLAASRRGEAAPLLFEAVDRDPEDAGLRRALAQVLYGARLGNVGDRERRVLARLVADDGISAALLSTAICTALDTVATDRLAHDSLLAAALPLTVFADAGFEARLASVRRGILLATIQAPPAFTCALARHCFLTEYAFALDADEELHARQAREAARAALRAPQAGAPDLEPLLATACLYAPLHSLEGADRLPALPWSAPFAPVVEEQVSNRRRECELAAALPTLTTIGGEVTAAVRAQYEENPYPRWATLQRPEVESFEALARRLRNGITPRARSRPVQVLVAGCGTGQHPAHVARTRLDSEVLAVDLSRASLGYAARMAGTLSIGNITFAQADLLMLGSLGRTFDIVESVGVLHHLQHPMEGWRVLVDLLADDGLMRIALYSTRARACILAARDVLRPLDLPLTPEGIRRCRQVLMDLPKGHGARGVLEFGDFYSLSGCRDLLMHVQERTYTPREVGQCLDALGLRLLKVESETPARESFAAMFPDPAAEADFDAWDRLEQASPDIFRGMIQFWCAR